MNTTITIVATAATTLSNNLSTTMHPTYNDINATSRNNNNSNIFSNTTPHVQMTMGRPPLEANEWCLIGFFLLIMVCGVMGNLLVIYVFGRKKKLRNTEHLILYLGIIDLMTSVFNPPLSIYRVYYGYRAWDLGQVACKVLPVIGPVMTTASGFVLLVFAVERYSVIVTPFDNKFTPTVIKVSCMSCVFLSAGMYIHYIIALTLTPPHGPCRVPDAKEPSYGYPNCVFIVIRLLSFLIVFLATNIAIYRTLRQNEQNLRIADIREKRIKQSRRIMRVLNIMAFIFLLLVFPRELLYLFFNVNDIVHDGGAGGLNFGGDFVYILNSWLKVAHTGNSCANVFIYAYMQDSYKRQIKIILGFFGCYKYKFERGLRNYLPGVVNNVQDETYDDDFATESTVLKPKLAGRMFKNSPLLGIGGGGGGGEKGGLLSKVNNNKDHKHNNNNGTVKQQQQQQQQQLVQKKRFNSNGSVFRKEASPTDDSSNMKTVSKSSTAVFFKRAQYFRKDSKDGQFKPL